MTNQPNPSETPGSGALPSSAPRRDDHRALESPESRSLYRSLCRKDDETPEVTPFLAAMYLGAKIVRLQGLDNPECLAQAAHSIREFIDALAAKYDLPIVDYEDLVSRTRGLIGAWTRWKSAGPARREKERKKLDREMERFASTSEAVRVTRREQAGAVIDRMDPSGRPLPAVIGSIRVDEWQAHRGYFLGVCHHKPTTVEEFDRMLELFEKFLVGNLGLRATEEKSALDRAIAEAEGR